MHHIAAHIYSNWLANTKINFPLLNIVVSGGHTELVFMKRIGSYTLLGETRDDAAGEAFDKVAKCSASVILAGRQSPNSLAAAMRIGMRSRAPCFQAVIMIFRFPVSRPPSSIAYKNIPRS